MTEALLGTATGNCRGSRHWWKHWRESELCRLGGGRLTLATDTDQIQPVKYLWPLGLGLRLVDAKQKGLATGKQ